jgi:hypothetical protein
MSVAPAAGSGTDVDVSFDDWGSPFRAPDVATEVFYYYCFDRV